MEPRRAVLSPRSTKRMPAEQPRVAERWHALGIGVEDVRAHSSVPTAPEEAPAPAAHTPARLFLLSPAHCNGERARQIRAPSAGGELARRLRLPGGAPLGDVFSFLSGLYFRGKVTYARAFAGGGRRSVLVITPGDGLR